METILEERRVQARGNTRVPGEFPQEVKWCRWRVGRWVRRYVICPTDVRVPELGKARPNG